MHLERLLACIHDTTTPAAAPSDLTALLRYVTRTVRQRTILVVVSDETTLPESSVELLRRLAVQHEVLFLTVGDLDPTVPALSGRTLVDIDVESEVPSWLRRDAVLQQEYAALVAGEEKQLRSKLDHLGIIHEQVRDTPSAIAAVAAP